MAWITRLMLPAIAGACLSCGAASARDLTVTAYGGASQDAQRKAYFQPFTKATGIALTEDAYDGGLAKIKAMTESGSVTWDVVDLAAADLARGCEAGYFETLDWHGIGEKANFIPAAIINDCGVGEYIWSNVLAYDGDRLHDGPKSWADFFDLKRFPGKRGLRYGPRFTLEVALMADGVAPADVYKVLGTQDGADRAFRKLDTIKSSIQWWQAGAQPPDWLASGDVVMTAVYNGRITAANNAGKHFVTVWNQQIYALDYWAVVKGSPFKADAMKMIAFMSQPGPMEEFSRLIPYGPARKDAADALDPAVREHLPTATAHMQDALASDTQFWLDHEEDFSDRFNAWVAH